MLIIIGIFVLIGILWATMEMIQRRRWLWYDKIENMSSFWQWFYLDEYFEPILKIIYVHCDGWHFIKNVLVYLIVYTVSLILGLAGFPIIVSFIILLLSYGLGFTLSKIYKSVE